VTCVGRGLSNVTRGPRSFRWDRARRVSHNCHRRTDGRTRSATACTRTCGSDVCRGSAPRRASVPRERTRKSRSAAAAAAGAFLFIYTSTTGKINIAREKTTPSARRMPRFMFCRFRKITMSRISAARGRENPRWRFFGACPYNSSQLPSVCMES